MDKHDFLAIMIQVTLSVATVYYTLKFIRRKQSNKAKECIWHSEPKVDIKAALRGRKTSLYGWDTDDFRLRYIDPSTKPEDYFFYVMNGLGWPKLTGKSCDLNSNINFYAKVSETDSMKLWIWKGDEDDEGSRAFLKELNAWFEVYIKHGQPVESIEPVEAIVARARGGEVVRDITKYGFAWTHKYDNV